MRTACRRVLSHRSRTNLDMRFRRAHGLTLGAAVYGGGHAVGDRWLFANGSIRWILQWPQGTIAACNARLRYGMPLLLFGSILPPGSPFWVEWRCFIASVTRSLCTTLRAPTEAWFPRACVAFQRHQLPILDRVLRTCRERTHWPVLQSLAVDLDCKPDLVLLPAAYVAVGCPVVRPRALVWDLAPACRYFDRRWRMLAFPPVFAHAREGRWRLPGQVDVDTGEVTTSMTATHRQVA